jgi:hypothetical protein
MEEVKTKKCAICGIQVEGRFVHIDHNHVTGMIRGVLCRSCNIGIGAFKDSSQTIRKAFSYLSTYGEGNAN